MGLVHVHRQRTDKEKEQTQKQQVSSSTSLNCNPLYYLPAAPLRSRSLPPAACPLPSTTRRTIARQADTDGSILPAEG